MTCAFARPRRRLLLAAAVAFVLVAGQASAATNGEAVKFWSVSKIVQGAGEVAVEDGAQVGGVLKEFKDVGRVVFNLPLHDPYWTFLPRDRAFGSVFSSADGTQYSVLAQAPTPNPIRPGAPEGAISHLDQYQAYQKQSSDASLRIVLSDLLLQTVDDNNRLAAWECPPTSTCDPVRAVVRFHARAYAASAGGDFFDVGGIAYLEGHQHSWRPGAATSADSPGPLWGEANFEVDGDADDSGTGSAGVMFVNKPIKLKVPLDAVRTGELFAVHVSLEAEAVNDRGGEAAAQSFIQDPQHGHGLLTTRGLRPRGRPRFKEPAAKLPPAARCPGGPRRGAGALQLSDATYTAAEGSRTPMLLVTRTGGSRGAATVTVSTRGGSAQSGRDFTRTNTRVTFADGDSSPRFVEIPLREDHAAESPETFTVSLSHPQCGRLGNTRSAGVTIIDDPQPPASGGSPTAFTIGGTVDGLTGSVLVLTNLGADLPVSGNGSFTFPGTAAAGQPYEINVRTQPQNPAQVCTVQNGAGHVGSANVTDIAVHCATPAIPSGLDTTFGSAGRFSMPGGTAKAVILQPDGHIVTVGPVPKDQNFHFKFGAVRVDAAGNLDQTFGTGGLASTDLGGKDDQPSDAALLPDGGFVAAGLADPAGLVNTDFGVARYTASGQPAPGFGGGSGFVTTDIAGHGDAATTVAVQPDGKIVVAGYALVNAIDSDVALARYNPDGTLDTSFSGDGIVTTDLGTESDEARAVAIQPDGKIVVAGETDQGFALARYLPDGTLDPTFDGDGKVPGLTGDANGVAVTPGGSILVAGARGGPHGDLDVFVASYTSNGTPDTGFGHLGIAQTDLSGGFDSGDDLVVDSQGRIVVVGSATSNTITDMALVRYLPDGTLDTTFDGDGFLTSDFHGVGDFGHDVAIDSQGRIVAAGSTANGSDDEFALMRVNP